jgi:hypothetical protein
MKNPFHYIQQYPKRTKQLLVRLHPDTYEQVILTVCGLVRLFQFSDRSIEELLKAC